MALIDYAVADRMAVITLNRPEKRNALNPELVGALREAFGRAAGDANVKVIILRAHGEAFCAGADLAYLQQLQKFSFEENLEDSRSLMQLYHLIYTLPKIVIAQVEGHALAGGCGLVTVCDFAFAVPDARFGYTEVRIGFVPAIVSAFLIRKIGEAQAKDLLLTGRQIPAEEAAKIGMIYRVIPAESIRGEVEAFALQLIDSASSQSLAATKKLIDQVQAKALPEALELAARENAAARATEDCRRGIEAFLQKKPLTW